MITEIRTEKLNHPTAGEITRQYIYTYDETKYTSLDDAIDKTNAYNDLLSKQQKKFDNKKITQKKFVDWQENFEYKGYNDKQVYVPQNL